MAGNARNFRGEFPRQRRPQSDSFLRYEDAQRGIVVRQMTSEPRCPLPLPPMLSNRGPRRPRRQQQHSGYHDCYAPPRHYTNLRAAQSMQVLPPMFHRPAGSWQQQQPPRLREAYSQPYLHHSASVGLQRSPTMHSLTQSVMACAFCRSNREPYFVYSSHWLRDREGKVTCPILRKYTCKHCGATGDNAHTDSYCPGNVQAQRTSMKSVLTTAMTSAGTVRKLPK